MPPLMAALPANEIFHITPFSRVKVGACCLLLGTIVLGVALPVAVGQSVTTTLPSSTGPDAVAVNPVTNQIYVPNLNGNNVTVINGSNNSTTMLSAGKSPIGAAANPVTNKIYVVNTNSNNVTVIDGATEATSTVTVGTAPFAVALNPVTDQIYVVNESSNNVTVIDG